MQVVKSRTKGDGKSRSCVDYILNALLHDNLENMRP